MSGSMKLSGNVKLFAGFILLYFALQIYFGLLNALLFRFDLYSQLTAYLISYVNQYLNYVAIALLIVSGLLLLGVSKLNQNKRTRIRAGAALLLILGIYSILVNLVHYFLQSIFYMGPTLTLYGAFSIVSLFLSAVTFLLVGTSTLRKRTRPLVYGGSLLLLLFCSLSIVGLILFMRSSISINGNITTLSLNSLYLHIVDFEIYAAWLPQLLYLIAFLFISQDLGQSRTVDNEKTPETKSEVQDKFVVLEK